MESEIQNVEYKCTPTDVSIIVIQCFKNSEEGGIGEQ